MTRKNLTKSYEQRLRLQTYYEQTDGLWTRQQLNAFADTIGLSRQRVYKWLWDKRNMDKKKPPQIKIQPRRVKRQAKPKAPAMHEFAIGSSEIRVPKDLRNAVQFKAIYPIPSWMRHTLKKVGWQLIQDSNSQFPKLPPEPQPYIKMYQEQMKEGQSSKWLMLRPSKFELVEQDCQEMPHMQCNFSSNFMQVENEEKGRTFDKYAKEGLGPCKIQRKEASDAIYQPES